MPPLPILVFVVGTGSLGAEIAAVRLLAPYFGASTIIWANTIATVLVALSAGYAIGGRLADRRADLRGLCAIVVSATVLLAIVPFVSDPFGPERALRRHPGSPRQVARSRTILAEQVDVSVAAAGIRPHSPDFDWIHGQSGRGNLERSLLIRGTRALPRHQVAAVPQQRRGQLRDGRERANRPGGDQAVG